MFERPRSGERAVLVNVGVRQAPQAGDLSEFRELARSAGVEEVALVGATVPVPEPRFFVGTGKAEEIRARVAELGGEVVLFNNPLSPAQERNLERLIQCRVLDRTGLILDIFAQRARSFEGKLQVELAQLRHLSSRLVRGWTHLERQKGGIGLRGPGETQLESDRRLIGRRIRLLGERLEKVRRQRDQGRRARRKAELPTVSLVGYTNAGKSTLFNRLTGAETLAENRLFATLDPTLRRLALPDGAEAILADTVGFIRDLPHDLVAAFRSTLEETAQASLLLQVVDAGDEDRDAHMGEVDAVLGDIGAGEVPQIQVMNKIDLLPDFAPRVDRDAEGRVRRVWVSAASGAGLESLRAALAERLSAGRVRRIVRVPASAGRLRARIFELGFVEHESVDAHGDWTLEVQLARSDLDYLLRREGLAEQWVSEQANPAQAQPRELPSAVGDPVAGTQPGPYNRRFA